jgi:hypothetical protein
MLSAWLEAGILFLFAFIYSAANISFICMALGLSMPRTALSARAHSFNTFTIALFSV